MIEWNYNMEEAPRGQMVESERVQMGDRSRSNINFVNVPILISFLDKGVPKVQRTYRTEPDIGEPTGRWAGLVAGNEGYAWAPYPEPAEMPR